MKILNTRVESRWSTIGQLSPQELKIQVDLLIFKACAITGADMPPNEYFADILSEELIKFLLDFGYSDYNIEEILLAYRLNASGIKYASGEQPPKVYFKGVLNINLSADVFAMYSTLRNTLDRKIQNNIDEY